MGGVPVRFNFLGRKRTKSPLCVALPIHVHCPSGCGVCARVLQRTPGDSSASRAAAPLLCCAHMVA